MYDVHVQDQDIEKEKQRFMEDLFSKIFASLNVWRRLMAACAWLVHTKVTNLVRIFKLVFVYSA